MVNVGSRDRLENRFPSCRGVKRCAAAVSRALEKAGSAITLPSRGK